MSPATSSPRVTRVATVVCAAALAAVLGAGVAAADDGERGRHDVRVAGSCGRGASAELRLKADDGRIEVEFEVDHDRVGAFWRVVLVHERRVVWRGTVRTKKPSGSFDVERRVRDLPGADTLSVRAWGPHGVTCRAAGTLPR
jgi:hypothetical protein